MIAVFGLVDWALMASLPGLGVSFGPVNFPVFCILLARMLALVMVGMVWDMGRRLRPAWLSQKSIKIAVTVIGLVQLIVTGLVIDAFFFEPFNLQKTIVKLEPTDFHSAPLRILQVSDLHVERTTRREREVLAYIKELKPDLILLTGDYINIDYRFDPVAQQNAHEFLDQLSAPLGVYAILGTPSVDLSFKEKILPGLGITLLEDRWVRLPNQEQNITIVGITNTDRKRDTLAMKSVMGEIEPQAYTILMYHTPDLIEDAAKNGVDLYLAGHTHGGQLRIPFYGALVTMSAFGKKYESGYYRLGMLDGYVSRGLGMEGLGLPRLRFNCPPELVVFELSKQN